MAGDVPAVPPALRAAYHARCDLEGASFADFLEEARGRYPGDALLALVDAVEADVLENIALMASARPDLEESADTRSEAVRAEMARLRAGLGGGG